MNWPRETESFSPVRNDSQPTSGLLTVTGLNNYVAESLKADPVLRSVRLTGQISGITYHGSGHWYFTLKDSTSSIDCVMFRQYAQRATFRPRAGDQVIVHGGVGIYTQTGRYQFYADSIRPEGVGQLWLRFEELKKKLAAEGLFDQGRKRPLPAHPRRIAVVTSPSGAVLHDICRVAGERDPGVAIVLVPVPVQGAEAAEQIADGVRTAGTLPDVDAVIVGRGGGSMEDLWCFNEACVAYAIAACPVPVVSAVGHETDTTIADFAADVRAATPSNAAEKLVPSRASVLNELQRMKLRLTSAADGLLMTRSASLSALQARLHACSPELRLREEQSRLRQLALRLEQCAESLVDKAQPRLAMARFRLDAAMDTCMQQAFSRLAQAETRLGAVSPLSVLQRGYAIVMDGSRVVRLAAGAPEHMTLRFADGTIAVRREERENKHGNEEKTDL